MGERTCTTQGCMQVRWPHESVTNALVTDVARRWPRVGWALALSLWPHLERPFDAPSAWSVSGRDADWEHQGKTHSFAEHKPLGAPGQWSWARAADYSAAALRGLIVPEHEWVPPDTGHEQSHPWGSACTCCKSVRGTAGQRARLAIPQVVGYALRHRAPCTLVTDLGDATTVYGTHPHFRIASAWVPVRTIPEVLHDLAVHLDGACLTLEAEKAVADIATRLWFRSPWSVWDDLKGRPLADPAARKYVRAEAIECALNH